VALPGLIIAARESINAVQTGVTATVAAHGAIPAHAAAFASAATAMGLTLVTAPDPALAAANITAMQKFANYLAIPGCTVGAGNCGYLSEIGAITPSTAPGVIMLIAGLASPAADALTPALAGFAPLADALSQMVDNANAEAAAKRVVLSPAAAAAAQLVAIDAAAVATAAAQLPAAMAKAAAAAAALYAYLV
jgi:hypothetical protein